MHASPFVPLETLEAIKREMMAAQKVVIISHRNPDADSVGANLALREVLLNAGKFVASACADPIPETCHFLKDADTFVNDFNLHDFDLVVTVDCGSHELMKFHEEKVELLDRQKIRLINIDHHSSNNLFGNINWVMPDTPSTCFMLFLAFSIWGFHISKTCASALMHGLYYDTGSFMHSNTSSETLRIAARLKALGADQETSARKQFREKSIKKLRLWGYALDRMRINKHQGVVSWLSQEDFNLEQASLEESSGLIDILNQTKESRFALHINEDTDGSLRASLRTQSENLDLSKISKLFGGGGHKKAAGFTIKA